MDLETAMTTVPCLRGATRTEELSGGLTNRNVRVVSPQGDFVVRLSSNESSLLAIDRENEYRNSVLAFEAGVGAEVVDYLPGNGVMVVRFIEGRSFTEEDVRDPLQWPRIAAAARQLHSGPSFVNRFDMFEIQRGYLEVVVDNGFRLPPGYRDHEPDLARIKHALASTAEPTVPCNNDLLAGNFIDTGSTLRLIDYEYSGNNDACFELGNIWSEATLPDHALDALIASYYGRERPSKVARARLWALMSQYGWTLWATIQTSISTIDFDFWSWGMQKYERAERTFASSSLDEWLHAVALVD